MTSDELKQWMHFQAGKMQCAGIRSSVLAFESGGDLLNIQSRSVLEVRAPGSEWAHDFECGEFRIIRSWTATSGDESFATQLGEGVLLCGSKRVRLASSERREYSWTQLDASRSAERALGWPANEMVGLGDSVRNVVPRDGIELLDRHLLSWSHGRLGSRVQLERFLGEPYSPLLLGRDLNCTAAVICPMFVRISGAQIVGDEFRLLVEVKHEGPLAEPLALYALHDEVDAPIHVELSARAGGGGELLVGSALLPRVEGPFDLRLLLGDRVVHERRVGVPRLQMRLHATFDPEMRWLSQLLAEPLRGKGSDKFEHYVQTLLNLFGCPSVLYGFNSPEGAPDVLAVLDEQTVLVGECKVVAPTVQVLETLLGRAGHIAQSMVMANGLGLRLVLFHAAKADAVPEPARTFAIRNGIVLCGRERLLALQSAWERGEDESVLKSILGGA